MEGVEYFLKRGYLEAYMANEFSFARLRVTHKSLLIMFVT
jgi:hypothetical protein